jgi:hypothetical protein
VALTVETAVQVVVRVDKPMTLHLLVVAPELFNRVSPVEVLMLRLRLAVVAVPAVPVLLMMKQVDLASLLA